KLDEKVEDDQEEARIKEHMEIILDEEEVAVDAILLETRKVSVTSKVITKESYERVLWGDFKTMFGPHVEDAVWKNLRGHKVLLWRLYDSCGVHFMRFQNMHVYMLVETKYPLTPPTITDMFNKKLQADHWNEICYQLLKHLKKQLKNK
ncbi:hypothetical protein Tco_0183672, partial [Tanacetum coccineum]